MDASKMSENIEQTIAERCKEFADAFAAGNVSDIVENYYVEDPLIIGDGVGEFRGQSGAAQYFSGAVQQFRQACFKTTAISETANGYLELGVVELTAREESAPDAMLDYIVTWRRNQSGEWRAALDYFTPSGTPR